MIIYAHKPGEEPCSREPLKVRVDGPIIGEIRKVEGGYQFFPNRSSTGGKVHSSVEAVKGSLRRNLEILRNAIGVNGH